jgi:hypothetical protein
VCVDVGSIYNPPPSHNDHSCDHRQWGNLYIKTAI